MEATPLEQRKPWAVHGREQMRLPEALSDEVGQFGSGRRVERRLLFEPTGQLAVQVALGRDVKSEVARDGLILADALLHHPVEEAVSMFGGVWAILHREAAGVARVRLACERPEKIRRDRRHADEFGIARHQRWRHAVS